MSLILLIDSVFDIEGFISRGKHARSHGVIFDGSIFLLRYMMVVTLFLSMKI